MEKGFTLIELMVVASVVAIFSTIGAMSYVAWVTNTRLDIAYYNIERDFLDAAMLCYKRERSYAGCTKADLVKYGMPKKGAWGGRDTVIEASIEADDILRGTFFIYYFVPDEAIVKRLKKRLEISQAKHLVHLGVTDPDIEIAENSSADGWNVRFYVKMP